MSSPTPSAPQVQDASALPVGTRLGEFELRSLLGVGGFGIVYLAFDHALEREVAVKEYMPASLAGRTETMHVSLRSQSDAETFALGLRSFVNEARLLARFDHPSLLKVLRFWEANGTAYMAMPVLRGRTLKEQRVAEGRAPDEATLRSMLADLLGALERLHSEGVYHRDIAPDNIQIEPGGHPVLLDFGAARRVLSDKTQTLTAILKPAYAPIEQYAETGAVKQGPWTDFYALGATLHYVLLGKPPAPATARAVFDESASLAGTGLPGYTTAFLQLVDWMLAPKPADRPQSVAELRQVLQGQKPVPEPFAAEPDGTAWDTTLILPKGLAGGGDATQLLPRQPAAAAQTAAGPAPAVRQVTTPPRPHAAPDVAPDVAPDAAPVAPAAAQAAAQVHPAPKPDGAAAASAQGATRRNPLPWLAAAAVAMVLAAVVFWPKSAPAPAAVAAAESTMAGAGAASAPGAAPPPNPASGPAQATGGAATAGVAATAATAVVAAQPAAGLQVRATPESEAKPAQPTASRPLARPISPPAPPSNRPALASSVGDTAPSTAPSGAAEAPPPTAVTRPRPAANPAPSVAAPGPANPSGANADASPAPARPAAAEASAQGTEGPEAKCAGRNPLSYFVCMERECLRSSLAAHPDCKNWRKSAKTD